MAADRSQLAVGLARFRDVYLLPAPRE